MTLSLGSRFIFTGFQNSVKGVFISCFNDTWSYENITALPTVTTDDTGNALMVNPSGVWVKTLPSEARTNLGFTYGIEEPTETPTTGEGSVYFMEDDGAPTPISEGGTGATTVEGILANLGIGDYIVERGTSGIWTYEKWKSGKIRMTGKTTSTINASSWVSSGSAYYSIISSNTFPFTLKSVTYFNWYIQNMDGGYMFFMLSNPNNSGGVTTNSTGEVAAGRLAKPNYNLNIDLFYEVEGTWK